MIMVSQFSIFNGEVQPGRWSAPSWILSVTDEAAPPPVRRTPLCNKLLLLLLHGLLYRQKPSLIY